MDFGPVAQALLARAHRSSANMVYVADYRELRAARKLVKRGVLVQQEMLPLFFLNPIFGDEK